MPFETNAAELVTGWVKARRLVDGVRSENLKCGDGFTISVQASEHHYCSPRRTDASTYYSFECGFPSADEPLLTKYAEEPETPTETVYGWVPASVVAAVVEKHGGLV